ncbi:Chromatin assembly factor 1 subunit fas1 [Rhynchospora pubera]|uniref:Chromatin assembly factor 1 subunit fas1 n=1 Tax=Rhynchospora pubera TaxID=906938 RepID=A0AAV8GX24_9POAL|nr:Chromatin assembly factor 1 subunit fas1 [Rhynchospora pubera]
MEDPMVIDTVTEKAPQKQLKRKRQSLSLNLLNNKEALILELQQELEGLFAFYKEVSGLAVNLDNPVNTNSLIAGLLEERAVSFSKLAGEIFDKVKDKDGMSLASVKSSVLLLGQRAMYGTSKADADVLEDESDSCLWCWETRDLKLFPLSVRGVLSTRRLARKKIHERISALTANMSALENSEDVNGQVRALSNLGKVLNLEGIRSLVEKLKEKKSSEMAEKEAKLKEKELIKEMEKNKRNVEKEKTKMDRQIQKEKIKAEKEQKRMQEEAEKEAKRREKEEAELKRQLKKQEEEAEREQKRREKEEAELKKQLILKKQASVMERFLSKSKKHNNEIEHSKNCLLKKEAMDESTKKTEVVLGAATLSMDSAFSIGENLSLDDIWRSHVTGWRKLMSNSKLNRWGFRRKPKTNVVKELKLLGSEILEGMTCTKMDTTDQGQEQHYNKILDDMKASISDEVDVQSSHVSTIRTAKKKLLQFDKSYRPAYYGTWSKKSSVIGPRHPFKTDPDLDYEVDSDEEWEEEDPGESLSDCEKDKEEELEEENSKAEEEDSEDSFFVPDGYLSEDEGIESRSQSTEEETADLNTKSDFESEEIKAFFKQQKVLHNLTEQALKKSQPLVISNLNHEKLDLLNQGLTGMDKWEQVCMQALCLRVWPGGVAIDLPVIQGAAIEDGVVAETNGKTVGTSSASVGATILDSDMPEFVQLIQSCPHGLNKVVDLLQQTFTSVSKAQLRNKVREISKFVDNHWEVKKEVLDALGLQATSPEKAGGKRKGIALYFSKRCLPPEGNHINISETVLFSCSKSGVVQDQSNGQQSNIQSQPSI